MRPELSSGLLLAALSYVQSSGNSELIPAMNSEEIIQSLLYSIAILLATAVGVAIILSRLFSTAIIRPISRLENAMAWLGKGDLTAAVPVENNEIIRRNSAAGAQELLDALIDAVTRFQKGRQRTDDITLVIVKVNESPLTYIRLAFRHPNVL